jgi:hypothetical protein
MLSDVPGDDIIEGFCTSIASGGVPGQIQSATMQLEYFIFIG